MPASLHRELVRAADADGVSLNQFICAALAGAVRWRATVEDIIPPRAHAGSPRTARARTGDEMVWELWRERFG